MAFRNEIADFLFTSIEKPAFFQLLLFWHDICLKNMCKQNKTDNDSYTGGIKNEYERNA